MTIHAIGYPLGKAMVELDADTRGIVAAARETAPALPAADVLARVELRLNWPHRLPIAGRIARAIGLGRDLAGDQRSLVARALLDELREDDVAFVRYLLVQELAYAEIVYNLCYVQTLQLCALMLYKLGLPISSSVHPSRDYRTRRRAAQWRWPERNPTNRGLTSRFCT